MYIGSVLRLVDVNAHLSEKSCKNDYCIDMALC